MELLEPGADGGLRREGPERRLDDRPGFVHATGLEEDRGVDVLHVRVRPVVWRDAGLSDAGGRPVSGPAPASGPPGYRFSAPA